MKRVASAALCVETAHLLVEAVLANTQVNIEAENRWIALAIIPQRSIGFLSLYMKELPCLSSAQFFPA